MEKRQHIRLIATNSKEFLKNRSEIIETVIDEYGYIFCQSCGVSNAHKFHCHHIMSKGRYPNHPKLDSKENLIILCNKCHGYCHEKADEKPMFRGDLEDSRNLKEIFK